MKIVINEQNSIINEKWQEFTKVRAVIINEQNEYAITHEAGKIIFPGGKAEKNEDLLVAIKRELKEELGVNFDDTELKQILEIETFYENYYDFRSNTNIPRHTITVYFLVKTNKKINANNQQLTQDEINQKFKIFFTNKDNLIKLLSEDHSSAHNGKYFDQENQIILEEIINKY